MEFRILGPLEVVENGDRLGLGAVQQRALLAVLVLHRGEAVSVDRLIDELWGERAPASATKTVQVYVSQLRKVLGAGMIVTEGRAYRLVVGREQVDIGRFDSLAGEGRRALAAGDPERARERLCGALELWRAEPLAEFTYVPFAQQAIARMQEARLAAVEDRIDAELALGAGGELVGELESLIALNPLQERLRGQLMRALYRAGRQADALAMYRQTSELLREELGLEPSPMLQELERSILEHDVSLDGVRHLSGNGAGLVAVCPFKGLAFFDRADAEFFCGRERAVAELIAALAESTLLGILGPSGVGKSSLLRAGLLPALAAGALPGSVGWPQLLLRPGEHPLAQLQDALGGDQLNQVLARLSPNGRIVVAVDQLEELFSLCQSEDERTRFLDRLLMAARDPQRRALVVVALRADFYGRLAVYPAFAGLLSCSHVLVGPMDREELARAIEEPAARARLEVERPLVDALVSEVAGEAGGLPLLSTTLLELWRARNGGALSYDRYRSIGGVHGAVARLAEAAYGQLGARERRIARAVLLRLASGEDGALTRRRVTLGELERIDGAGPVLSALTDARLLTVSEGEVELSHEALLREWPRYRGWLEEDRIGRRVHAHLTRAAGDWEARDRDPGELYRGARLAGALDWAAQHGDQLNALEREFIQSSRMDAERTERRQRAQNRRLRSLLLGAGLLLVVAVIAGIVALTQRESASNQATAARTAAHTALASQLGAQAVNEPRLDRAMLLAREALNLDRSPQTEGSLLATLQRNPAVVGAFALPVDLAAQLAVSPDGRTLAASHYRLNDFGTSLGDIRFYDPHAHARQWAPLTHFAGLRPPVYSNDASLLLYPTDADTPSLAVHDTRSRELRQLYFDPLLSARLAPDLANATVLVAPDRRTVYCVYGVFDLDRDQTQLTPGPTYLARWSLPSGRLLSTSRIDAGPILAAGLAASGARLLVVDARSLSVFDSGSAHRLSSVAITLPSAAPVAAAISPDGAVVAIASQVGQLSFVDSTTGTAHATTRAQYGAVKSLSYSPDGKAVASTGNDNRVIVWDARTAAPSNVLTAPAEQVQYVAFSPDSHTLYTSSLGGILLAWDLTGKRSFGHHVSLATGAPCCGPLDPLAPPLALSPDGATFAVPVGRSTIGLFSARTLTKQATFNVDPSGTPITALAWSPNAPVLAAAGHSGLVQLWHVDGKPRLERGLSALQRIAGQPEAVQALAFSTDGRLLAATDTNVTLTQASSGDIQSFGNRLALLAIWRTSTGNLVGTTHELGIGKGHYGALAFSRDGTQLAVSRPDGTDQIFDPNSLQPPQTLSPLGSDDTVSLAFAPNGTLATGTEGGIAQLWNPHTGSQVAGPVAVAAGPVTSIAFDPTGQRFVTTGGSDGNVKLWAAPTLQQEGSALTTEPGAATTATFAPDGQRLLAVDDHGNGFTWPTSLAAWQQRACTIAGRNLTRDEWSRYVPGQAFTTVCSMSRATRTGRSTTPSPPPRSSSLRAGCWATLSVTAASAGCGNSHSNRGQCLPASPAGDYPTGLCGHTAQAVCTNLFTPATDLAGSTLQACSPFVRDPRARLTEELFECEGAPGGSRLPDAGCVGGNFPPYDPRTAG